MTKTYTVTRVLQSREVRAATFHEPSRAMEYVESAVQLGYRNVHLLSCVQHLGQIAVHKLFDSEPCDPAFSN